MFEEVVDQGIPVFNQPRRRTPTVIQMEAVECGAAALGSILAYYKKFIPLEKLRYECGVSRDGSKASNVLKAARKFGFEAKGFRKEMAGLKDLKPPYIVFWNFNHFVVLEGFVGNTAYLNDPATGPRKVSIDEFDKSFTGIVLTFKPGPDFKPGGSKPNLIPGLIRRIRGSGLDLTYVVLVGLALVIPGLLIPIFSKIFVDNYLIAKMESWVKPLLIGMALTAVLRGMLTWLQEYYLCRFQKKLALSSSAKFFWHAIRLPEDFFVQRSAGDIGGRVGINDRVAQTMSGELATTVVNSFMVIFYAALMFWYDIVLTMVGIFMAAMNILVMKMVARKRVDTNMKLATDHGKMMGTSMNGLYMIESLKASGGESDFFARWSGYQAKVLNGMQDMGVATNVVSIIPSLLTTLNTVFILAMGGLRVMSGDLSMGMLVAFQSLMSSFTRPISELVGMASQLQELQADMNRLDDVLRYEVDHNYKDKSSEDGEESNVASVALAEREKAGLSELPKLKGHLELRNVTFGYSRLEPPLIENFSLKLEPGVRVAIIGGSGCGKSTILKLVMGLYQPWEGEVLLDGKKRDEVPREILTNSLAMVDQDILLFRGSVRDNITMWDKTISDTRVVEAAKSACIHDDIASRKGAYESDIEEGGGNFSGGQRQRMEIARAFVSEPSVVVLDEATSALDTLTEQKVDDAFRKLGCTTIIVAHRLSTIRDADEIIVLERGKVIQRGTHNELLLDTKGLYYMLIHSS